MKTRSQLEAYIDEACALGNEAIKICFKANALAVGDPKRWPLTQKMLEINHRLKQIAQETGP